MKLEECAASVVAALEKACIPHMLVGGLSSNIYSIPRSTKDVDFVVKLESSAFLREIECHLPDGFTFDPQITFENITGNVRHLLRIDGTPLVVELFELREGDAFQSERFRRRKSLHLPSLNRSVPIPTAEDVVVQKLRWARPKDLEDARGVMAVQGSALDYDYIRKWCLELGILDRLETVRRTVPKI
ncbi:MAG: hypothetical protein KDL87_17595 [Verrucomicrobiae bacterium]|nr:hypothetical protein [Verrucomicrobiae bacterium]